MFSVIFQICLLLPIMVNILAPETQFPLFPTVVIVSLQSLHAPFPIPSSAFNSRFLTCHTRQQFLSLTLKFSSILVPNDLCLAASPHSAIPTSNTAGFLLCSRTPCTRKYSPFTHLLRLGENSLLWPSSLTLCFPGLVDTISPSGWPVDQSTLPLTNCISLHLILQFFKRFVSLTANTWGEATHHTPRGHGHSYQCQVKSRSKLQIQTCSLKRGLFNSSNYCLFSCILPWIKFSLSTTSYIMPTSIQHRNLESGHTINNPKSIGL